MVAWRSPAVRSASSMSPSRSSAMRRWLVDNTNAEKRSGTLKEVLAGADVFIGVSAPNILDGDDIAGMAKDAIVFGLANPIPEVDPIAPSSRSPALAVAD